MISRNFLTDAYPKKQLGDVVEFLDSMRRPVTESDRRAGGYPYYGANGLQGTIDDFIFDEPLVLLAEDGGHFGTPDRGIAYRVSGKTWVNNHAHVLRPRECVDLGFLCRVLENYDVTPWVTGTTRGKLTQAGAAQIVVPLPPLPEQRRIAEILDKADALRAKRRAALAQLDTLTQSIFLDMFGDPISNPRGWPTVRFEQLCERVTVGIVVQPASYYVSEGVPALRSLNIRPGKIVLDDLVYFSKSDNDTKLAKTKLRAGDVVLVRSGQPGTAAVVPPELDGVNAIDILIATPDQQLTNPTFLCEFFNSAGGRDLVLSRQRGQVQKHLNVGSLNQAILPLPSIDLQCEFAARVAAVERYREAELASSTALDALFASLQHRAFRGEL